MLDEADVRSMVRLVGEVAGVPGGHAEKKRYLMDGIKQLIDADSWVWTMCVRMVPGEQPVYAGIMHGGLTDEQFAGFLAATSHPDEADLFAPIIHELQRAQSHTTRLRQQTDPQNRFATCESRALWIKAGIYPGIISVRPLFGNSISGIGIYREPGRPDFTERESRMAHIILTEVPWLHEQGWPEDRGVTVPHLAPRQRITLNLLLQGQSRKQIAHHMGISINTVSGYVKDVYKHFGVQAHAELMKHFMMGDGGDLPRDHHPHTP